MTTSITSLGNLSGQQLISTITSAPPLIVNNTNLVSNLNVQYFNNQLSSFYTNASNISSGVLNPSYGGTGITSIQNGALLFGYNNVFSQTSNLYYNFSSKFFGINTCNPAYTLDINGNTNISGNLTITGNIIVQGSSSSNTSNTGTNILSIPTGGTGLSNISQGYLLFGQGSNSLGSSSNLFWNNTSNYLGIGTSNPISALNAIGTGTFQNNNSQIQLVNNSNGGYIEVKFSNATTGLAWSLGQATYYSSSSNFGFYNNYLGSNTMTFLASNNFVGIGTTTPQCPLHVGISSGININGSYGFLNTSGASNGSNTSNIPVSIQTIGRIISSEFDAISDYRTKTNIQNINFQFSVDLIQKLKPVSFNFKQSDSLSFGFIAQDLLKNNFNDLVSQGPNDDLPQHIDQDNFLSPSNSQLCINYNNFIAIQTSVIQNLLQRISSLETDMKYHQKLFQKLSTKFVQETQLLP